MYEHDEDNGEGDWRENRRLVSANFRQLFNKADEIIKKIDEHAKEDREQFAQIKTDITTLRTSAGIWGLIGGFIATIVSGVIVWKLTSP